MCNFLKKFFSKNPNLTKTGLEKALEMGLITEEEYHRLKIERHENALQEIAKKHIKK